ncbi:uncharacterized protein Tco025E_00514 [Trypanosoma conorhini]|uniref:Uncharacterized protein n=1 Tax=Trypanosoma conorhini TaxID=83891 RepID=A0A3R7P1F7_9TRYP|nr:uncharacterized protein Tco025E_00514 [Trypanosoma conorhini]RNF27322.1 hypothetical protein Tco025E_00514 [Trypanosoma conorhini]
MKVVVPVLLVWKSKATHKLNLGRYNFLTLSGPCNEAGAASSSDRVTMEKCSGPLLLLHLEGPETSLIVLFSPVIRAVSTAALVLRPEVWERTPSLRVLRERHTPSCTPTPAAEAARQNCFAKQGVVGRASGHI